MDRPQMQAWLLTTPANLYGTTSAGCASTFGTVCKVGKFGKEKVLHGFTGTDGTRPLAGLILDGKSQHYGTAFQVGSAGDRVVFMLAASGTITLLHKFTGMPDGEFPAGSLLMDAQGNLRHNRAWRHFQLWSRIQGHPLTL